VGLAFVDQLKSPFLLNFLTNGFVLLCVFEILFVVHGQTPSNHTELDLAQRTAAATPRAPAALRAPLKQRTDKADSKRS
jgi:hypothetical protein